VGGGRGGGGRPSPDEYFSMYETARLRRSASQSHMVAIVRVVG
jgi:hypothetical protein